MLGSTRAGHRLTTPAAYVQSLRWRGYTNTGVQHIPQRLALFPALAKNLLESSMKLLYAPDSPRLNTRNLSDSFLLLVF